MLFAKDMLENNDSKTPSIEESFSILTNNTHDSENQSLPVSHVSFDKENRLSSPITATELQSFFGRKKEHTISRCFDTVKYYNKENNKKTRTGK